MTSKINLSVIAALATVAFLQSSALAATYTVGDSANWGIPSSPNTYSDWAADKSFVVGDILVFNFMANRHDVTEVSKSAYDSCSGSNPISQQTSTPVSITLATPGEHYYICTFSNHCTRGQKLAANVTGAPTTPSPQPGGRSPSPAPTGTPTRPSSSASPSPTVTGANPPPRVTTTAPPPQGNGAASLGVAGLSATFLSTLAVALVF